MKTRVLSTLLWLVLPIVAWGQPRGNTAEQEVKKFIERFSQAFVAADVAALTPLLAEEYVHTNSNGSTLGKPQWLAYIATRKAELASGRLVIESYVNDELRIQIYGATAVVTGRNVARGKREGQAFTMRLRFTHVWVKRKKWQRAAFHDSAISQ
jgi:ketosteroid isomerase-like protein